MIETMQKELGKTLWNIADKLRGAMNPDDFRDYMLSFLFLRYLSDNYENAVKKNWAKNMKTANRHLVKVPLKILWLCGMKKTKKILKCLKKQMRRKVHYVIQPDYLWSNITELARTQSNDLLSTLQNGFKYIENESFEVSFRGLFSEVNLDSEKLGKNYTARNAMLCNVITEIAKGLSEFPNERDLLGDAYEYLIGQFAAGSGKKQENFIHPSKFQKSCLKSSPAIAVNRIRKKII